MSARRRWTPDEVRALGVSTDLVTACEIAFGIGRTKAGELHRRGELPLKTIKVGRRIVVPVAQLLELLGIDDGPPTTGEKPVIRAGISPGQDGRTTSVITCGARPLAVVRDSDAAAS